MSVNESLRLDGTHGDNWVLCDNCGEGGDRQDMERVIDEALCHTAGCAEEARAVLREKYHLPADANDAEIIERMTEIDIDRRAEWSLR